MIFDLSKDKENGVAGRRFITGADIGGATSQIADLFTKSTFSALDPPIPARVINIRKRSKPAFKPVLEWTGDKLKRKKSIGIDLNVHFDGDKPPRNARHWPLDSGIREVMSNALDAAFESLILGDLVDGPPSVEVSTTCNPFAGYIAINRKLAISFSISIDEVRKNDVHTRKKRDSGRYPAPYVEVSLPLHQNGKKTTKPSHKSRAVYDSSEDDSLDNSCEDEYEDDDDDDDEYDQDDVDDDDDDDTDNSSDLDCLHSGKSSDSGIEPYIDFEFDKYKHTSYRISLSIRNIGAVMPMEAWVNSFSTKGREQNPILRECVIGGFGYGLKDAVLCLFGHNFRLFEVYANEPMGDPKYKFYRGMIERTRWNHHEAPTLCMKVTFLGAPSGKADADTPQMISNLYKKSRKRPILPISNKVDPSVRTSMGSRSSVGSQSVAKEGGGGRLGSLAQSNFVSNSDLPSTVVMIGSVVTGREAIKPVLKKLLDAVQAHHIFGSEEFFSQLDVDNFMWSELNKHNCDDPMREAASRRARARLAAGNGAIVPWGEFDASRFMPEEVVVTATAENEATLSSSSSSSSSLSSSNVKRLPSRKCQSKYSSEALAAAAHSEKSLQERKKFLFKKATVTVAAPCVDEEDLAEDEQKNFYAQVTVQEAISEARIYTWPGLRVLRFAGKKGLVTATGTRFSHFTFRFPQSFKQNQQRDRVHIYGKEIGSLCGSAIVAVCRQERHQAAQHFPDTSSATAAQQVVSLLREALVPLPCNVALAELLVSAVDEMDGHSTAVNINVDSLMSYGDDAMEYISTVLFPSFQPVAHDDEESAAVASAAHADKLIHKSRLDQVQAACGVLLVNQPIQIPMRVPHRLMSLFCDVDSEFESLKAAVRSLVLQVSASTLPWYPPHDDYRWALAQLRDALQKKALRRTEVIVLDLNIDPVLLEHLDDASGERDELGRDAPRAVRVRLTKAEGQLYRLAKYKLAHTAGVGAGAGGADAFPVALAITVPVCSAMASTAFTTSADTVTATSTAASASASASASVKVKTEDPAHHEHSLAASESVSVTADESSSISQQIPTAHTEPGEDPAIIAASQGPAIILILTSSRWSMSPRDKVVTICADGNSMFEAHLRDTLYDPDAPPPPPPPPAPPAEPSPPRLPVRVNILSTSSSAAPSHQQTRTSSNEECLSRPPKDSSGDDGTETSGLIRSTKPPRTYCKNSNDQMKETMVDDSMVSREKEYGEDVEDVEDGEDGDVDCGTDSNWNHEEEEEEENEERDSFFLAPFARRWGIDGIDGSDDGRARHSLTPSRKIEAWDSLPSPASGIISPSVVIGDTVDHGTGTGTGGDCESDYSNRKKESMVTRSPDSPSQAEVDQGASPAPSRGFVRSLSALLSSVEGASHLQDSIVGLVTAEIARYTHEAARNSQRASSHSRTRSAEELMGDGTGTSCSRGDAKRRRQDVGDELRRQYEPSSNSSTCTD